MQSAWEWKQFYADERQQIGTGAMHSWLDAAEPLSAAALVVPHTRLSATATQFARAANTVVASGADRVLALGVLHGARRVDAPSVARARHGDSAAIDQLRGVHTEAGLAAEEFSLDTFSELLTLAAHRQGRQIEIVRRYPFLVGDDPASLPGLDELTTLAADSYIVATTDPMHHGAGYGTPAAEQRERNDPATIEFVRRAVTAELAALQECRYTDFAALTATHQSDFRDTGPVFAELLTHIGGDRWQATIDDLSLVAYADVLDSPEPTWVAAALVAINPAR